MRLHLDGIKKDKIKVAIELVDHGRSIAFPEVHEILKSRPFEVGTRHLQFFRAVIDAYDPATQPLGTPSQPDRAVSIRSPYFQQSATATAIDQNSNQLRGFRPQIPHFPIWHGLFFIVGSPPLLDFRQKGF